MEAERDSKERCHRPMAFDKMEGLVREMQDKDHGVPVRSQKLFLTSIPAAFMGYDLIEWLMERLSMEESEALNLANQLCQYGYIFPVGDMKNLIVKDDSSLYRFQGPYFWPWHRSTDSVEYAIYLVKRTLRNRQRHALEDYEMEALANLKKNLAHKWEIITAQAEEEIKATKDYKKVDKIVRDSQERAYWRLYRPPPGISSSLEQCPMPNTLKDGSRIIRKTVESCKKEVDFLKNSLLRTRIRMSQALETMLQYVETFTDYDPAMVPTQPSNPWVTDDQSFWQLNSPFVENPIEKRVRRWGFSMEELITDPTGLQEFTNYLRKEYSHENIRFWMAVNDLRRSALSQIQRKVKAIFAEFLAPGAPCEINIDGKTMEKVHQEMKSPSRFTFDAAQEHVYTLLLKKDCYPRFIRSEHYKNLLATGVQPSQKKRFFSFGPVKKKTSTSTAPNPAHLQQQPSQCLPSTSGLSKRRGSDRSLSGSAHELAISGVRDTKVPHSHSQSNLSDIPYRAEVNEESSAAESATAESKPKRKVKLPVAVLASGSEDVCPWESVPESKSRKNSSQMDSCSSSSDVSSALAEVPDRLSRRPCGIMQQSTFDGDRRGPTRKLSAGFTEQRRASVSVPIRHADMKVTVSSFEPASKSVTAPVSPGVAGDTDNKVEEFVSAKTFKLSKACSVSGTSPPVISVSSVLDDTTAGKKQETKKIQEEEAIEVVEDKAHKKPQIVQEIFKVQPKQAAKKVPVAICVQDVKFTKQILEVAEVHNVPVNQKQPRDATKEKIEDVCKKIEEAEKIADAEKAQDANKIVEAKTLEDVEKVEGANIVAKQTEDFKTIVNTEKSEDAKTIEDARDTEEAGKLENTKPMDGDVETLDDKHLEEGEKRHDAKMIEDTKRLEELEDVKMIEEPGSEMKEDEEEKAETCVAQQPLAPLAKPDGDSPVSDVPQEASANDVCPWEDEETCKADVPFVKTYSTLGYL